MYVVDLSKYQPLQKVVESQKEMSSLKKMRPTRPVAPGRGSGRKRRADAPLEKGTRPQPDTSDAVSMEFDRFWWPRDS